MFEILIVYKKKRCKDAYWKTLGGLWKHYRDEPTLDNIGNVIDFPADNNDSTSFKFKQQITGQTGNSGTKDVEIMVPLKNLSDFWRTLEMSLINCEISLQLKWSRKCIMLPGTANNQNKTFQINDAELYVPFVTLSTQESTKLLKELESGIKKTVNWNEYLAKTTNQEQNWY